MKVVLLVDLFLDVLHKPCINFSFGLISLELLSNVRYRQFAVIENPSRSSAMVVSGGLLLESYG